jgi:phage terminase Nu1 subunit (DNA packaging protein)
MAAVGVCYRCGLAGGCNCAAQAPALPRLYTEAELAARVEAAAVAMRAQIAEWIRSVRDYCVSQRDVAKNKADEDLFDALARDRAGILGGIALMPLPDAAALVDAEDRGRAEGWKAGMQVAAQVWEEAARIVREHEAHIPTLKARDYPDDMGRLIDDIEAAIRAKAQETRHDR